MPEPSKSTFLPECCLLEASRGAFVSERCLLEPSKSAFLPEYCLLESSRSVFVYGTTYLFNGDRNTECLYINLDNISLAPILTALKIQKNES